MMKRNETLWIACLFIVLGLLVGYHPWIGGNDQGDSTHVVEGTQRILLEMVGPSRLGAVSFLSKTKGYGPNYELAKSVKVSLYSYAVEKIVYLHPDLVLAPEYTNRDVLDGLDHMGIPVVIVSSPKTVQGTLELVERLGVVVGAEHKARDMTAKMQQDIEEVKALSAETKGQVVISMSSMDGYAGSDSLFDDMTRVMGLVNGPSHLGYAPRTAFTEERIIEMDPNVILIPVYDKSEMAWQTLYRDNPGLQTVRAVREGRVVTMPASDLYTGNQFIGESMKDILRILRESEKGDGTHE